MPKRKRTGQRAYAAPQGGYVGGSDSDNNDSDKSDSEENKAGAPLPTEHRFITVNRTRQPQTALALLQQSSRRMRLFKRQRVPRSLLHPSGYIPSGQNVVRALGTTMCDFGSNMNTLIRDLGGGVTKMFCETLNAAKDIAVAALAAAPPVAQATVPWVAQAMIAVSTLTGLALQSPGAFTTLVGGFQVVREGGVWQALMRNLGYAPT